MAAETEGVRGIQDKRIARMREDCVGLFGVRIAGGGPHFHLFAKPGEL